MEDTSLKVLNSKTGQESLCSTLKVKDDQTDYVLQCERVVCGDGLKLTVEHSKPGYDYRGCLHIGEIEVRCPAHGCEAPGTTVTCLLIYDKLVFKTRLIIFQ